MWSISNYVFFIAVVDPVAVQVTDHIFEWGVGIIFLLLLLGMFDRN